jgi:lysyl-tRNA synthetase class 2
MEEINELIAQRIKKLQELRDTGIEPYSGIFEAEDRTSDLHLRLDSVSREALEADPVSCSLAGRIVSMRMYSRRNFR